MAILGREGLTRISAAASIKPLGLRPLGVRGGGRCDSSYILEAKSAICSRGILLQLGSNRGTLSRIRHGSRPRRAPSHPDGMRFCFLELCIEQPSWKLFIAPETVACRGKTELA